MKLNFAIGLAVLHLLLATKLLPDMEEAEQKVLDQEGLCTEEAHIEDLYARLSKQLDDHNEILQHLTVKAEAQDSGVLDPKVLLHAVMVWSF